MRSATTAICWPISTDVTGFRQYTLHVKDLRTGELLPDRMEKTISVDWAGDNRTLFYTVEDDGQAALPPVPASRWARPTTRCSMKRRTRFTAFTSSARAPKRSCS